MLRFIICNFFLGIGLSGDTDVEHLPEAVPSGNFKPVQVEGNATFIAFDLETTDLGNL